MRAYELLGEGPETLALVERERPRPGPGQVLVRIRAASLNYRDLLVAAGKESRDGKPRRPLVPLSDGAGEVIELGPGVTRVRVGERVIGSFFRRWIDGPFEQSDPAAMGGNAFDGVLAEEVVREAEAVTRFPDHLSFEEAATLPCAGLTAWMGLVELGKLAPGETVLAMGTGGVSLFALQLAKLAGARVILTSSRDDKLARGKALGADELVNYRTTPDWDVAARALTGGRGVDHILEVGGAGTLPTSLRALRDGGHLTVVGLLSGRPPAREPGAPVERGIRVDAVYVGSVRHQEAFCELVARTGLRPVVDRVFPFEQARQAFEALRRADHFGKLVVAV
jgi:NADPH:quinone reductase-like Zn-dependent oxidoreductase